MPQPLTVSCFSKIQIGFTFLVPAHPGSPGQRAVKHVCVCISTQQATEFIARVHLVVGFPVAQVGIEPVHHVGDVVVFLVDGKHEAQKVDQTDSCIQTHTHTHSTSSTHYCPDNTVLFQQHTHTQQFNGLLSGTTRVGRYQKKHSPTHTHPDHRTSSIAFLHLQFQRWYRFFKGGTDFSYLFQQLKSKINCTQFLIFNC